MAEDIRKGGEPIMSKGAFSFELTGFKDLMKCLDQLPTVAMKKTVLRNSLLHAGGPVVELAKALAPYDPRDNWGGKHLRDTITTSTKLKASQRRGRFDRSRVTVYIGSTSPLAHLIEFGTVERQLKEPRVVSLNGKLVTITTTGRMTPNPFMRTAWDRQKYAALEKFRVDMEIELLKAARRLAKRAAAGRLTRNMINGLS